MRIRASRRRERGRARRFALPRNGVARAVSLVRNRPREATFFLVAVAFAFTVGPILRYCKNHRYFAVRAIEVHGVKRLDAAKVRVWLGMEEGSSVWAASPRELEARLEAQPPVARAEVRRILPDRLQVVVRERVPQAILRHGPATFLVDRAGIVIGPAPLRDGDLPIITLGAPEVIPPISLEVAPAGRAGSSKKGAAKSKALQGQAAVPTPSPAPASVRPAVPTDWMPAQRQLRQAVSVARLLEQGQAGVMVSEIGMAPGSRKDDPPELVAYSNDGRLTIRLGWGDWARKLDSVRRVLAVAAGQAEAPAGSEGAGPLLGVDRLGGSLDARNPSSIVARWAHDRVI